MTITDGFITSDDGLRLFYRRAGDGSPLVVFINGVPLLDDFAPVIEGRSIVFFDPRNRGFSDAVRDTSQIERGIHHDLDDIEAIRRHFGVDRVDVIGHSYAGFTAAVHAMTHPDHVNRVVQLGPIGPDPQRKYPPHLHYADETFHTAMAALAALMKEYSSLDPVEFCRRFLAVINPIYVMDPADIAKLKWARCDSASERGFFPILGQHILPSIHRLNLGVDDFHRAAAPTLVVHGRQDRSAPYGGGRDWAHVLPNARLLTIEGASHVPWIEAPDVVLDGIRTFLDGDWPAAAERVTEPAIS
jgi:pimeloyl-ACP methyl ester carboxylesterase